VIIHPGVGGKSVRGVGSDRQQGFFAGILPEFCQFLALLIKGWESTALSTFTVL
jgi:hypothetical protein